MQDRLHPRVRLSAAETAQSIERLTDQAQDLVNQINQFQNAVQLTDCCLSTCSGMKNLAIRAVKMGRVASAQARDLA